MYRFVQADVQPAGDGGKGHVHVDAGHVPQGVCASVIGRVRSHASSNRFPAGPRTEYGANP
ncbi:hypothetical protein [Streptomyces sp. CoH17]|uniref:hypothetical protein n=1 Tax=Streptomyces sp. CoH17 TaxID=2992806 RepID=UPI003B63BE85